MNSIFLLNDPKRVDVPLNKPNQIRRNSYGIVVKCWTAALK